MKFQSLVSATVICASLAMPCWSATAVISALKDNAIFQSSSNNSAGGSPAIHVGTNGQGFVHRGLVAFDIAASVPSGSTITSAELTMYVGNAPNATSRVIGLHKLGTDWGEGSAGNTAIALNGTGSGFPAGPADATWSHAMFGSVAWANPGATGDFNAVASASLAVGGAEDTGHTWPSTETLVTDVQSWLDAPATNFGWILINASEATNQTQKVFYSRSATQNTSGVPNSLDPYWHPTLTVAYVPEPSAALLLFVAGMSILLLRNRSRN
jgi:hypothetical protein